MVTINTSEDLLRALRENPEWKEAVRREILTEELMNLPARFDRFVEEQVRFNEEQRRFNEAQLQFNSRVDQFMVRTDNRFARLEDDIANFRSDYARTNAIREAEAIADDMASVWYALFRMAICVTCIRVSILRISKRVCYKVFVALIWCWKWWMATALSILSRLRSPIPLTSEFQPCPARCTPAGSIYGESRARRRSQHTQR